MLTNPSAKIRRNFELAATEAISQKNDSVACAKHGAIVVKNGKILGKGLNTSRSYVRGCAVASLHAESSALLNSLRGRKPSSFRGGGSRWSSLQPRQCLKWG